MNGDHSHYAHFAHAAPSLNRTAGPTAHFDCLKTNAQSR
jgi:hypothetical protein